MGSIEEISQMLDEEGIRYQLVSDKKMSSKILSTMWRAKNQREVTILLFISNKGDWINVSSKVDTLDNFDDHNKIEELLLRLNLRVMGTKFCVDSNSNIYCNAELFFKSSNSESIKKILVQTVNAVSLYYQEIIKK
jgi:hypothetical protein